MSLAEPLETLLGAPAEDLTQLSGGSSRETWSFTADGRRLILQLERQAPGFGRLGIEAQARLLRAARAAGVPAPKVVAASDEGAADLGGAFVILDHVEGETIPRRILRDEAYAGARRALTGQVAEALARIHAIPLDGFDDLARGDALEAWRSIYDGLEQPQPALELGFRWLGQNRPTPGPETIVHGDFRMGNLIVGPDGLRAVIDWELAHVGDPLEDLGWMLVRAWRFGSPLTAGGVGTREELIGTYARVSGRAVDVAAVHWWEVFGSLRWGVICILQARRHLGGSERSVELATIGRRVCEAEHDLLLLLP